RSGRTKHASPVGNGSARAGVMRRARSADARASARRESAARSAGEGMAVADDDGSRDLVVPALLPRIERDPDEAEAERNRRDEVAEVADDRLADAEGAARL